MKIFFISLSLFICTSLALAFDGARAKEVVSTIASDDFQGRRPGTSGGWKTEEFLAERLKSYGIEHGGDKGYFQDVPLLVTEEDGAELTLMNHEFGKITFTLGSDFTAITHSGTGAFIAPVVIAGMGYIRPDKDRDDYGETDVRGKIVVIVRDHPDSPYDFSEDYPRDRTLAWAKERGAAAVLWYQDERPVNGGAIPEASYDPTLPMMYIGDRVLDLLLDNNGYSIDSYKAKLKEGPLPIVTKRDMWVSTDVRKKSVDHARNVLGIIWGSDPVLKNEIVVIGAHMDHIGMNAQGIIYNGADDNGAGTGLLSELARSLVASHATLKRSVLIIHFTGEEDGLLGSKYFAQHPIIPLNNIACMLNFDMSGQGTGDLVMGGGDLLGRPWQGYVDNLSADDLAHLSFYREDGHGASDNYSFTQAGVPAVAFWAKGKHPFYHSIDDDPKWISESVLQKMGDRAEDFVQYLCNYPGQLAGRSDSTAILARLAETIDFSGITLDAKGTIPPLTCTTAAWIPDDAWMSVPEMISRLSEFQYACSQSKAAGDGLAQAIGSSRKQKMSAFAGISQSMVSNRRPQEIEALYRMGLSVVKLSPSETAGSKAASSDALQYCRDKGMYALIPMDYSMKDRVDVWKKQAIITGNLAGFAALSESVRNGLLKSDALVVLEVTDTPTVQQIQTILSARARKLHLNFGSSTSRERDTKAAIDVMYSAGLNREGILMLTGGNLRRCFDK